MPARTRSVSEPKSRRRCGRIALVGRPNVGKSSLLNALLNEPLAIVSPKPQTTRDAIAGVLTRGDTQFVFVDTPGLHVAKNRLGQHMNHSAEGSALESDVVVFVTDAQSANAAERGLSEEDEALLSPFTRMAPENQTSGDAMGPQLVLALNKIDKLPQMQLLLPTLSKLGERAGFAALVPISAKTRDNIDAILDAVEPLLPEGPFEFESDELSDRPVRFFAAEYVREQALKRLGAEVPHGLAVVVESFEEERRVPRIAVVIHVAKETHKGILIGKGGQMLKAIGSDARRRVERFLGRQVHLEINVRVTADWYDRPGDLKEFGYDNLAAPARGAKKQKPSVVAPPASGQPSQRKPSNPAKPAKPGTAGKPSKPGKPAHARPERRAKPKLTTHNNKSAKALPAKVSPADTKGRRAPRAPRKTEDPGKPRKGLS
jgi:GTP-binding protein Era